MREILFRGKCAISSEWVQGDLIHGVGHKSGNIYILPSNVNLASVKHCDTLDGVKVIPETIGQFTGTIDDIGNKIFEGDIMTNCEDDEPPKAPYIVTWDGIHARYVLNDVKTAYQIIDPFMSVVGNIHDSPELIQP